MEDNLYFLFLLRTVVLWGCYGATLVALLVFLYLCWLDGCCPHKSPQSATPVGGGNTGDFKSGPCADQVVTNCRWIRMAVFLLSVALCSVCAIITLVSTCRPGGH